MRGMKIPQRVLCAKNTGGAYARGGAYLRDTTVYIYIYIYIFIYLFIYIYIYKLKI